MKCRAKSKTWQRSPGKILRSEWPGNLLKRDFTERRNIHEVRDVWEIFRYRDFPMTITGLSTLWYLSLGAVRVLVCTMFLTGCTSSNFRLLFSLDRNTEPGKTMFGMFSICRYSVDPSLGNPGKCLVFHFWKASVSREWQILHAHIFARWARNVSSLHPKFAVICCRYKERKEGKRKNARKKKLSESARLNRSYYRAGTRARRKTASSIRRSRRDTATKRTSVKITNRYRDDDNSLRRAAQIARKIRACSVFATFEKATGSDSTGDNARGGAKGVQRDSPCFSSFMHARTCVCVCVCRFWLIVGRWIASRNNVDGITKPSPPRLVLTALS